jgi:hypothetical protein
MDERREEAREAIRFRVWAGCCPVRMAARVGEQTLHAA